MQKYVYYLSDSPNYPNEIFASSKAEVKKLILESVPDESHILKIVEANPSNGQAAPTEEIDPNDFNNSEDYFKAVMAMAQAESSKQSANVPSGQQPPQAQQAPSMPQQMPQIQTNNIAADNVVQQTVPVVEKQPAKIFEEAGMFFKLEDGKLYKKQWVDVSSGELPQFRIKQASNGRIVPSDKYIIEKLEWVEIKPD